MLHVAAAKPLEPAFRVPSTLKAAQKIQQLVQGIGKVYKFPTYLQPYCAMVWQLCTFIHAVMSAYNLEAFGACWKQHHFEVELGVMSIIDATHDDVASKALPSADTAPRSAKQRI